MSDELSKYEQREIAREVLIQKEYEARVIKWDGEHAHQERLCQLAEKENMSCHEHRDRNALRDDKNLEMRKEHHQDWCELNEKIVINNEKQTEYWGRIANALEKIASK